MALCLRRAPVQLYRLRLTRKQAIGGRLDVGSIAAAAIRLPGGGRRYRCKRWQERWAFLAAHSRAPLEIIPLYGRELTLCTLAITYYSLPAATMHAQISSR